MWMKRDLGALAEREFDLVVVGAGIYGAATAWDAALRGLSVALVDKGDFGGGTSFNNLKTIHGGVRYLQHADLKRMRESIRERRHLMRIAPHLVHPLPFLVPTYRGGLVKSLPAMRAALFVNDVVSWDRNKDADPGKLLPGGRSVDREECVSLAPGVESEGLTGGVVWHDAQMHNSDRMTLCFIRSAAEQGAVVANHVECTKLVADGTRVRGIDAVDRLTGDTKFSVRAKLVVNTTGPWTDTLTGSSRQLFHFSKAMNLVTRRIPGDVAVGVVSRRAHTDEDAVIDTGGRFLCVIPWRNVTLVGTAHGPFTGTAESLEVSESDVVSLIDDINAAYPGAALARSDVRLIHHGLLPRRVAAASPGGDNGVTLLKSYLLDDHREDGLEGLLSVVGVKYTTARDVAVKAVDRALEMLGASPRESRSHSQPLVGGDIEDFDSFVEGAISGRPGLGGDVMRHLALTYGTLYESVLESGSSERLSPESPVLEAEIHHAVRHEMAFDLPSVVLRRTELGSAGRPSPQSVEVCASILQSELGWSDRAKQEQVDSLEEFYRRRT